MPARVLVVAEHPDLRRALVDQLNTLGLNPWPVPDSATAASAIQLQTPSAVLLALEGPDPAVYLSLLRLATAIHTQPTHIPLIAVVGKGDVPWLRRLHRCIDAVLEMPLRIEALYATLALWLRLPPLAGHASDEPPLRVDAQACIDVDVYQYERALVTQNTAAMIRFAHRAKGAALVLRATRAAELADRLEQAARGHASLEPHEIRHTLSALKEAIAHHFACAP